MYYKIEPQTITRRRTQHTHTRTHTAISRNRAIHQEIDARNNNKKNGSEKYHVEYKTT